jgi:hypothetical protein
MEKRHFLIIGLLITAIFLIVAGCTDEDEDNKCESRPSDCITTPPASGDLIINVTLDNLNPNPSITIYNGDVDTGTIAGFCGGTSGLCQNITVSESTIYYNNIPAGYYSVIVTYNAGDGNTVTAIDGDSNDPTSVSYCEGPCYSASTAEIDVEFDSEAFQDYIGSKKDKCFIATAAYGSNLASEVAVLRNFRDEVLMKSDLGRAFIRAYYRNSPAIAGIVEDSNILRPAVRILLTPIVYAIKYPLLFAGVWVFMSMSIVFGIFARNSGKKGILIQK